MGDILASSWYVLSCSPRKERVIYHQLRARGFDVFFPYIIVRTNDPNTLRIEAYFPGYLFIKVDLSQIAQSTFQWMPMTSGLVCIAGKPALVPDPMVMAIQRAIKRTNSTVLGMPEELETAEKHPNQSDGFPGNGSFLDLNVSGGDRTRELLQILNGLTSDSEH